MTNSLQSIVGVLKETEVEVEVRIKFLMSIFKMCANFRNLFLLVKSM